jgi:hypothetical protein
MWIKKENGQMIRINLALILGFAVLLTLCHGACTYAAAPQKNVLLIIIDDLRPNLGCYGDPIAITPNIDRLAASGTRFSAAYCQYPVCNPSRISFLTGMRPDTTRAYRNSDIFHRRFADTLTLNRYVQQFGYEAIGLGKIYHASNGGKGAWTQPYVNSKWLDYASTENRRRVCYGPRYSLKSDRCFFTLSPEVVFNGLRRVWKSLEHFILFRRWISSGNAKDIFHLPVP